MTLPIAPIGTAPPANEVPQVGPVMTAQALDATTQPLMPHQLAGALEHFGASVGRMDSPSGMSELRPASVEIAPQPTAPAAEMASPAMKSSMGLMLETFNFSINTELVSRAVSEFTGSIDALVKTQ